MFKDRLKLLRNERCLTQQQFADQSGLSSSSMFKLIVLQKIKK